MTMTRSAFLALLTEGLRKVFFNQYNEQTLVYPRLYDVQKSKKRKETDQGVVSIGMLTVKPEGEAITYEDFVMGYDVDYIHTSYAKGIRITRELVDDELYGVMSKRVGALGRSARYRKEYDHALIFNNASTTTTFTGGDNLALLSAAHTLAGVAGTTKTNFSTGTALSLSALETAFTNFREMVDDKNQLISLEPSVLLIPAELEFDAYEILKSSGKPYTADNERNFFEGKLQVVVWPHLTSATRWFLLSQKTMGMAPISFDRTPLEFERDGDFDTKDLKVSAFTRYTAGFSDWRWVYAGG